MLPSITNSLASIQKPLNVLHDGKVSTVENRLNLATIFGCCSLTGEAATLYGILVTRACTLALDISTRKHHRRTELQAQKEQASYSLLGSSSIGVLHGHCRGGLIKTHDFENRIVRFDAKDGNDTAKQNHNLTLRWIGNSRFTSSCVIILRGISDHYTATI